MDTCKSDLINHLEFQDNFSLYIINKLHRGKCFCTIFTHTSNLFSQNSLARKAPLVRFVKTNSCVNIVRQDFP